MFFYRRAPFVPDLCRATPMPLLRKQEHLFRFSPGKNAVHIHIQAGSVTYGKACSSPAGASGTLRTPGRTSPPLKTAAPHSVYALAPRPEGASQTLNLYGGSMSIIFFLAVSAAFFFLSCDPFIWLATAAMVVGVVLSLRS